jgi:hypothetical protein
LYELLFRGLVRTTAQEAQRKANAGRTDGRRGQATVKQCLDDAWGALARWRPEAESGYPLRLIIGIQRDNSTYFSNA